MSLPRKVGILRLAALPRDDSFFVKSGVQNVIFVAKNRFFGYHIPMETEKEDFALPTQEAIEQYGKALKAANKEFKELSAAGKNPYPEVLDQLLPDGLSDMYQEIGLAQIPVERVVGVKSAGRITAFTAGFLPLLEPGSEFAIKWMSLCDAHLSDEGIREPILCYEYLGNFYIQEGNKRLSVLRSFGAARIDGYVRRVQIQPGEEPEKLAYQEFLEFYKVSKLYDVRFTAPGGYPALLSALGKEPDELWDQWERRSFCAYLQYFKDAFYALGGANLAMTPEEALLVWLKVYTFPELGSMTGPELKKSLSGIWNDLKVQAAEEPVRVETEPVPEHGKSSFLNWLTSPDHLNIAFLHQLDPKTSPWAEGHERGRLYLQQQLEGKVTTRSYFHADTPEQTAQLLDEAVADGAQVIFTTTPRLSREALKAAVKHPKVRFFSCSVDMPYSSIRSYYFRIYEGKFITGAIAGAMADNDRIGYVASYPICGETVAINAFALGAQMTNPRARIDLRWSCLGGNPVEDFIREGYQVISNRDVPTLDKNYLEFGEYGTYAVGETGNLMPLASPCWLWGTFYEKVAHSILNGTWETGKDGAGARNYWWGMDSGVIDVTFSEELPESMRFLAQLLRQQLQAGKLDPFMRRVVAQDGSVKCDGSTPLTAEELLHMDWLCENVDGRIPEYHEVLPFAQPMLRQQGLHKEKIPPEKETDTL